MFSIIRDTPARLGGPASVVIVVLIVVTAVLVVTGMPPLAALGLTGGAGAAGAVVVRAATAGPLVKMAHRALVALQASAAA